MTRHPSGIVVGYDGSDPSGRAVEWAAAQAERSGSRLTVLRVVAYGAGDSRPEFNAVVRDAARRSALDGVERARMIAPGIDVVADVRIEGVTRALVDASRTSELTVVGSRGHGELAAAALGSVAFSVSAHAHSPVVVVRGDGSGPPVLPGPSYRVVAGADGSDCSDAAVLFAADLAAAADATLEIVTSYRTAATEIWSGAALMTLAAPSYGASEAGGDVTFEAVLREQAEITAVKASMLAAARHPQLKLTEQVAAGSPARVLADAASGAALLVVGSRGRGAFAGLTLGSVSHGVIHEATCPVAVVREQVAAD